MIHLEELYFLPPLAIARVGGSSKPLESFRWVPSPDLRGAARTVIEPSTTLAMSPKGILRPYLPKSIRFRDGDKLRPVAPFFELWVRGRRNGQEFDEELTLAVLRELGLRVEDLRFEVTAANKKAQRRTGLPSCGFVARTLVSGGDCKARSLMASSPHDAAHKPMVLPEAPIPLGVFQVARAVKRTLRDVDLSVIRVRFTPAKGEVYGPPTATSSVASPLPEGQNLVWSRQMQGRMHEMVVPRNRILSADSAWSNYTLGVPQQMDPQPSDSYDGAKNGEQLSWGVVDDTCDGLIQAQLVFAGQRFLAHARFTASPPDYAPDRRMFYSVADDLADRDLHALPDRIETAAQLEATEDEVVDLLSRVFETATQINLDAERHHYVCRADPESPQPPHVDRRSMTDEDVPYARRSAAGLIDYRQAKGKADVPSSNLQYTRLAEDVHEGLMQRIPLLGFLASDAARVRKLIRPPFGRFRELAGDTGKDAAAFRDPRVDRDGQNDMRMPPYMLDSDCNPLSLTWRQYHLLMSLVEWLAPRQAEETRAVQAPETPVAKGSAQASTRRWPAPVVRIDKVHRLVKRREARKIKP